MAITYPVTCPTALAPNSVRWRAIKSNSVGQNPMSFQTTIYEYDGEMWGVEVSYPSLTREEAAPFFGFLASLRGEAGTFLFGDTLLNAPLGAGGGTPKVNGAGQAGNKTLVTDGWPNSTLVLKTGDFFSIDNRLYMSLTDITSNGSGAATIDIFPAARTHADNASLVLSNPKGTFKILNSEQAVVEAGTSQLFTISFDAVEAL